MSSEQYVIEVVVNQDVVEVAVGAEILAPNRNASQDRALGRARVHKDYDRASQRRFVVPAQNFARHPADELVEDSKSKSKVFRCREIPLQSG